MLQKNNFYTLTGEKEVNSEWIFWIKLNPTHRIYEGHFPDLPIVPGVCTLQIIKECAQRVLQHGTDIIQISSCKYLAVLNPVENPYLEIQLSLKETEQRQYLLLANGKFRDTDFVKLKATLLLKTR